MAIDININPKRASKKGNTVCISGDLTIANANYIKQELSQALQKYGILKVNIEAVESLDLSVLQLIFAFQRAAISEDKQIDLKMDLPEDTLRLVKISGLEKIFNQKV